MFICLRPLFLDSVRWYTVIGGNSVTLLASLASLATLPSLISHK